MKYPKLDKTIHEQTKLKILTYLSGNEVSTFVEIKKTLKLTSGNLSIQLKTLEEKGLVEQKKLFENRKPKTEVNITKEGRSALIEYLDEMETLLSQIKKVK